ncbi:MAG: hypothetical protein JXR94_02075 [Candidatus Hydrogenedentes bacterium]|nr:hypothetical protein [Candidatus Hydrogenedentota bacterium]
MTATRQLVSYIAPAAPATRRPASGDEPFLRPELGFTPRWYRNSLGLDFGPQWHNDPAVRRAGVQAMRAELRRRFPRAGAQDRPLDLLTGTYGATVVAGLYGVPHVYAPDNWPNCEHRYLSDEAVDCLEPPDLDESPLLNRILDQIDWIAAEEGVGRGYINWQGVLNNAHRLRGQTLFLDMMTAPGRCHRLLDAVCTTMIDAAQRVYAKQRQSGFDTGFFTVSNCLVNMVSPGQYREFLLPYDLRIAEVFGTIGIHNCAWTADPYLEPYSEIPHVGYIDMGIDSDLVRARALFPEARRALMYTPMDLAQKPFDAIRRDLERLARDYAPCDVVFADIEAGTPDERVQAVLDLCDALSQ